MGGAIFHALLPYLTHSLLSSTAAVASTVLPEEDYKESGDDA